METTNKTLAQFLESIATLMRLAGENEFRAIAFEKVARTIETMTTPIQDFINKGTLSTLPGIGKSIENDILAFVETGTAPILGVLQDKVPDALIRWLGISGLGPKRIYKIHKELSITTIDELKTACEDGRVATLPGFGKKSAEKILKSLEWMLQYAERCLLNEAEEIANHFYDLLKNLNGVKRIEIAGSLRRKMETIGDIDFLIEAAQEDIESIFSTFIQDESVVEVLGKGATKCSVRVKEGRQVDIRIVNHEQFGAALMYFTGSKEHNVVNRQRARNQGRALNEYGLFELDENGETHFEKRIAAFSEEEIYQELGLQWIPPEQREDFGEFKRYENGKIAPQLVEQSDIKGVIHAHSTYSDGHFSIEQMAQACIEKGYQYLGISDHSKTAAYANGLHEKALFKQWKEIDALNASYQNRSIPFRIFKGIESDILTDGNLDYSDDILKDFDFVIASVHFNLDIEPQKMLDRFKRAVENPYCRIIGHPTGRLLLKREGNTFNMNSLIEFAAAHQTAIEINAHPKRLDLDWRYGQKAIESDLMTSINPDAHHTNGINDIRFGVSMARKAGFSKEKILNCFSTEDLEKWFEQPW